ncbi:MAG: biotin--[acetyl-CoA-carboxylase] ligase [Candidatus Eisenbacteria bacterium]|nr:biotin--[acetyl-CoA-carboxylase] ligase [Candidatus Eisenbacteria bacterium]
MGRMKGAGESKPGASEHALWSKERILSRLETVKLGRNVRVYDRVGSTNDILLALAEEGEEEGLLVIAEEQTTGRGRLRRKWYSPRGVGIWMSILLKPDVPAALAPGLSFVASVAVVKAIRRVTGLSAFVKWPNDVLVSGKKVAGILTEMAAEPDKIEFIVLGVGINVNQDNASLPDAVGASATSLGLELGRRVDRYDVLLSFLCELESLYLTFCRSGLDPLLEEWKGMTDMWGKRISVRCRGRVIEGIAHDVDESGALIVRLDSGIQERILSGDVGFV